MHERENCTGESSDILPNAYLPSPNIIPANASGEAYGPDACQCVHILNDVMVNGFCRNGNTPIAVIIAWAKTAFTFKPTGQPA
jgi:hypothetical protein